MSMTMFGVKVEEGKEGKNGQPSIGPVYRNPISKNGFPSADPDLSTTWQLFRSAVDKYPGNRMLGWRDFKDGKWGPYNWKTYKEAYEEILQTGSALRAHGIEPGARIGIYGANCPQWIVAMEACSAHNLICVPLYDTLGPGAVNFIIEHAEIDIVFYQDKKVKELLNSECTHAKRLKLIVSFTSLQQEEKDKAVSMNIKPYSWNEFLNMGKENPSEPSPPQPLDICTIMYTSGTSGEPKGVILTHENMTASITGVDHFMEEFEDKMTVDDVYISFLPLAHILDRMIEEFFFHRGASVGYFHGNINEIQEDMMALKPTFLAGVPRVYERVHEGVLKALDELNPFRRRMFHLLYNLKLKWMNLGYKHKYASRLADLLAFRKNLVKKCIEMFSEIAETKEGLKLADIFTKALPKETLREQLGVTNKHLKEVKARLGGRIRLIVSGGAPLSSEVEEFLRVTSCGFVLQGYGLTETCGLATIGHPDEMCMLGTVGPPFVFTELRLEEVPEMGYDPLGDPPRGEICVRGRTTFAGYYKKPELTREAIKDGWFHTGDIGEMMPNGVVKIIDRKKNVIKLSQGEYVALEYLEKVYGIAPIVEDIWVYGDSFKSMLVAVVVPHEGNIKKWADQNGHKGSIPELCSLQELNQYVLLELKSAAERNKLRGFENIKGVILEPQPFEFDQDVVTATMKKRRERLLKRYKVDIVDLYQRLNAAPRR